MEKVQITNAQRLNYVLDLIAEPFPDKAKEYQCDCGDEKSKETNTRILPGTLAMTNEYEKPKKEREKKCKRDLVEESILNSFKVTPLPQNLNDYLTSINDAEIEKLISKIDIAKIDAHLHTIASFMDPTQPTSIKEIVQWDKQHNKDF